MGDMQSEESKRMNAVAEVARPKNEIVTLVEATPSLVLIDKEKFSQFYEAMKEECDAHEPDLTTEKGRKAIASLAYKVARTKTAIDDAGKALNEEARARINAIDESRLPFRWEAEGAFMSNAMTVKPYRPSNGTEGEVFHEAFCYQCRYYGDVIGKVPPCAIQDAALALQVDDPGYPAEWIEDEEGPRCTAFEPIPIRPRRERRDTVRRHRPDRLQGTLSLNFRNPEEQAYHGK
jgi:hypothetical protein